MASVILIFIYRKTFRRKQKCIVLFLATPVDESRCKLCSLILKPIKGKKGSYQHCGMAALEDSDTCYFMFRRQSKLRRACNWLFRDCGGNLNAQEFLYREQEIVIV